MLLFGYRSRRGFLNPTALQVALKGFLEFLNESLGVCVVVLWSWARYGGSIFCCCRDDLGSAVLVLVLDRLSRSKLRQQWG